MFTGAVTIKLFVDDIKIYLEITGNSDLPTFHKSVDDIANWVLTWQVWQLKLAKNKCQHISSSISTVLPHFSLQNNMMSLMTTVTSFTSCRDLGTVNDCRLFFSEHINPMMTKTHLHASILSHDLFILI